MTWVEAQEWEKLLRPYDRAANSQAHTISEV